MTEAFEWLYKLSDIKGVLLVGSYGRGNPKSNSDIDLIIIVENVTNFLETTDWLASGKESIISIEYEDWIGVQSARVFYEDKTEIEYSFTLKEWADIDPIEEGTYNVLNGGFKILYDPNNYFEELCDEYHRLNKK